MKRLVVPLILICQNVHALAVKPIYDRNFEIFRESERNPNAWFKPNGRLGNGQESQTSIINAGEAYKNAWESRDINAFEVEIFRSLPPRSI